MLMRTKVIEYCNKSTPRCLTGNETEGLACVLNVTLSEVEV